MLTNLLSVLAMAAHHQQQQHSTRWRLLHLTIIMVSMIKASKMTVQGLTNHPVRSLSQRLKPGSNSIQDLPRILVARNFKVFRCTHRTLVLSRYADPIRAKPQRCHGLPKGDWPHETAGAKEAPCGLTAIVRPPKSH